MLSIIVLGLMVQLQRRLSSQSIKITTKHAGRRILLISLKSLFTNKSRKSRILEQCSFKLLENIHFGMVVNDDQRTSWNYSKPALDQWEGSLLQKQFQVGSFTNAVQLLDNQLKVSLLSNDSLAGWKFTYFTEIALVRKHIDIVFWWHLLTIRDHQWHC